MTDNEKNIKPALELIRGYAYGNKITRQDLRDVLFLAKDFNGRDMLKLLSERKLVDLVEGDRRFPGDDDIFRITKDGFEIIDQNRR